MKQRFVLSITLLFIVSSAMILFSCKHKIEEDQDLYLKAKSTTNFVWYKNSSSQLQKSSGTGHSQPFLNTRFNDIAQGNLTPSNKVKAGSPFANGSLIVKELYDSNGKLELYAILYKMTSHANADSKGWVWGYINAGGSVRTPSSKKGSDCTSCHSQTGNEDYTLMNKYSP